MQTGRAKQAERDVLAHFIKNASYTESYHDKYYYPELVHKRIVARKLREGAQRTGDNPEAPVRDDAINNRDPSDIDAGAEGGPSEEQRSGSAPPSSFSAQVSGPPCTWYLSAGEPAQQSGSAASAGRPRGGASVGAMADKETVEAWDRLDRPSCAVGLSSESVTSDDSVFSEDYTEPPEGGGGAGPVAPPGAEPGGRRRPAPGSDNADSSFSSPGSSTSTLEADGKEDGGAVEDAGKDEDEAVRAAGGGRSSPPLSPRARPNIRLLLGHPVADVDDGSPSPPPTPPSADEPTMKKSGSSSFYEDREFDFLKAEPVRRSTSLKTYKTPPGTPHRKKAVRFADALGLDLESVRHILNLEEPPEVPKSAMRDLAVGLEEERRTDGVKYLSALFSQPGVDPGFLGRVQRGKVVLESCVVDDREMTVSGTVRVANVSYHKTVVVRCTTNGWLSSDDVVASYVQNSNDGPTDRFSFTVVVPKYFAVGQRMEFAVMYAAGGATYWDNNYGKNYVVECYARAMPVSESDNTWMHFL